MKWHYILGIISILLNPLWAADNFKVVCFFDSSKNPNISLNDLSNALDHCSHFVYGYATLVPHFFSISFDGTQERTISPSDIGKLKQEFPQVKFLLSLGGDRDVIDSEKYLHLLETTLENQNNFINSIVKVLKTYKFDGIDLAYQFPKERVEKPQNDPIEFWRGVRNALKSQEVQQPRGSKYKKPFSKLIMNLHDELKANKMLLSLSVLPNVNGKWYLDVPTIAPHLDLVNLWLFDFQNPLKNPNEADYSAPLWPPTPSGSRPPWKNVNVIVNYWKSQNITNDKIMLGIPLHGLGWAMPGKSVEKEKPIAQHMQGPSGLTDKSAYLEWPKFCRILNQQSITVHGSYDYGQYFVYPKSENIRHGSLIVFDGPNIAQYKSLYAKAQQLGGVAAIDLSSDDYQGICTGVKFPILKYISHTLLKKYQ